MTTYGNESLSLTMIYSESVKTLETTYLGDFIWAPPDGSGDEP